MYNNVSETQEWVHEGNTTIYSEAGDTGDYNYKDNTKAAADL